MDPLQLSDSDDDALFNTPAARKNKTQGAGADATEGAAAGKTRAKESHYTTEEAREAALRRELESVRNVNRVIEGVVESLEKARNNMDVWQKPPRINESKSANISDCVSHCPQCLNLTTNMDPYSFTNRAQPASSTQSAVAGS